MMEQQKLNAILDKIGAYIHDNEKHSAYDYTNEKYNEIKTHANGDVPVEIIENVRPNESKEVLDYRISIYEAITKAPISKVLNSLNKIRKSNDWSVKYKGENDKIKEGEKLQEYCEKNYPDYTSITNFVFSELLKQYLIDANAVVLVYYNKTSNSADFNKPIAKIFNSDKVLEYNTNFVFLLSDEKAKVATKSGSIDGEIYYYADSDCIIKLSQANENKTEFTQEIILHNLGKIPAFKTKGVFDRRIGEQVVFESRIASMIPRLNEAAREYSDNQAEKIQHIHSEKWVLIYGECKTCKGLGVMENKETCSSCGGKGTGGYTPFTTHEINAKNIIGQNSAIPTPPMGYVQKDVEIVKIQEESIGNHLYQALAAINMEFLATTPLSQSGIAKEVDRDELNNFVSGIAEDLVYLMDNIYFFINEFRNQLLIPNKEERLSLLPTINVPQKYDLLTPNYLLDEIKKAKESGVSTAILEELESEYVSKKFNNSNELVEVHRLISTLNPLKGLTADDKLVSINRGLISETDLIISNYIVQFVQRAVLEYSEKGNNFFAEKRQKQIAQLEEYAKEKKTKSASDKIMGNLNE